MLYISTDYVFDGENAPHGHDAPVNPKTTFGKLKSEVEDAVLKECKGKTLERKSMKASHFLRISNSFKKMLVPDHIILRAPMLYGPVEHLRESAISMLAQQVKDKACNTACLYVYG